jgi:hypothetical protein
MREDKLGRCDSGSPCDNPVSVCFNGFRRFSGPEVELKVTEVLDGLVVRRGRVHPGEDDIEIDCFSGEDVVPLHVREFWDTLGAKDSMFSGFDVNCLVLNHLPGELLTRREEGFFNRFVSKPGEK